MIIDKVCQETTHFIRHFNLSRKSAIALERSPLRDTLAKSAEKAIPEDLQIVLNSCNKSFSEEREFFTELYKTGRDKFKYIIQHEDFGINLPFFSDKAFLRTLKQIDEKELKKTFDEITELYKTLPKQAYSVDNAGNLIYEVQKPYCTNLAQLTILKANNKEAYYYILKHPDKEIVSELLKTFGSRLKGSVFETLTIPQIRQITREGNNCNILRAEFDLIGNGCGAFEKYVESSDALNRNLEESKILKEYLSRFKVSEPFTAFRAERDTGMFNSIVLDKKLTRKTKWLVIKNMFKSKKISVHAYMGNYDTFFAQKRSLFDYIIGKEELSLADAMQVAKFGDKKYRKQIIELIKDTKIIDSRFKSLTFDKEMAKNWLPSQGSKNTGILHDIVVQEGAQGKYSHVNNKQAEFVLNNNEKTMTFQEVTYDAEKDIFRINSTIS